MRIGLISLGCSKNLVDSEMILGLAKSSGHSIVGDIQQADILFINTCGFIQSAKQEAIATIFDVLKTKKASAEVFVVGCLAQRYLADLEKDIPEVAKFIKIDDYHRLGEIINTYYQKPIFQQIPLSFYKRVFATPRHVSYIRIADGCDNRCSYCAIPLIRGSYHSRAIQDIAHEVTLHVEKGHREINLISQDTTHYGHDIHQTLVDLLKALVVIPNIHMIRLLYLYPHDITDELIEFIRQHPVIAPYFDMPIQHASISILKKMYRRDTKEGIYELVHRIRKTIPQSILRTTVIVGFPGETEDDFDTLIQLIQDLQFDRLGAFQFSGEEDTPAATMEGQVDEAIKERRYHTLMKVQQKIAHQRSKQRIGDIQEAYVEGYDTKMKKYKARDYSYAPDNIDGYIYVDSDLPHAIGDVIRIQIVDAYFYDLLAIEVSD